MLFFFFDYHWLDVEKNKLYTRQTILIFFDETKTNYSVFFFPRPIDKNIYMCVYELFKSTTLPSETEYVSGFNDVFYWSCVSRCVRDNRSRGYVTRKKPKKRL